MSIQPFTGRQKIIIEKRHSDGSLDFSNPQPPSQPMTFDALYDMYFATEPSGVGAWESLSAWLKSRGWIIRAKTW